MMPKTSKCLSCGSKTNLCIEGLYDTRFGIETKYDIVACTNCNLEQIYPLPDSFELKNLYENHYNFGGEKDTKYTSRRQKFFSSFLYFIWLALDGDISFHTLKGSGKLLDVGCNEGRGLQIFKKNGFDPEGLELNEVAAQEARSQGFTVYTKLIYEFEPERVYDVLVLSNVLEHSLEPKNMLSDAHRVLVSGGKVCISCPNSHSFLRVIFGRHWINWHVPFHIVHFSTQNLSKLLEESGFINIKVQYKTPALWVAHSLISYFYAVPGKPTTALRSPTLIISLLLLIRGFFFPLLWIFDLVKKGDCLIITAIKA
jgi:2-polyprenyl-3-methyl-5-hydroxy-6-metoxy-1,4-benzoquinol methylase